MEKKLYCITFKNNRKYFKKANDGYSALRLAIKSYIKEVSNCYNITDLMIKNDDKWTRVSFNEKLIFCNKIERKNYY